MELWSRARSFAEETAKEATKRSQHLPFAAPKWSNIIAETKEIAAQASNHIKHLAEGVNVNPIQPQLQYQSQDNVVDLHTFGITEEFREFLRGITVTTFRDFPLQDDTELSDVPAVSNVRQDLTEWQQKHASLVLSTVEEISKLRYELCPRVMKERKFWRIYFILVNSHIAAYENRYIEDAIKSPEQVKNCNVPEPSKVELKSNQEMLKAKKETKTSTSSTEQDLDEFLLGDMGDGDNDPDDGDGDFDDDLDRLVDSVDDEKGKS